MISQLAHAKKLAVVSDFDGTLAEFSTDRFDVHAHPDAISALEALAALENTTVAVLSGRDITGLRRICPLGDPVIFGGSHGAQTALAGTGEVETALSPEGRAHLTAMEARAREIVRRFPGTDVEVKPFQVVLHVRELSQHDPDAAQAALDAAASADTHGFPFTLGKGVAEFSATTATKGSWLNQLRADTGATICFLGDDVTDEHGFQALRAGDVGVKVGPGATAASARVADVNAVAAFLTELAAARAK
ncbi:trehalose phosphatase [Corynebacterium phocae]|uniref:Trehalose 6-phosphate phosphatase n=1 Tax=Corynebacterium phocae TaxID=161895 RepID=A0A1L7D1I4_9CORY|nr:trehalose-phosphatase [Corynebacterium phocae]APT91923.1 trehalose phosphatase [Corynebacterium phocae]KAA8727379.1 trehalose-phosphatase [Corynebacterium phocae]